MVYLPVTVADSVLLRGFNEAAEVQMLLEQEQAAAEDAQAVLGDMTCDDIRQAVSALAEHPLPDDSSLSASITRYLDVDELMPRWSDLDCTAQRRSR